MSTRSIGLLERIALVAASTLLVACGSGSATVSGEPGTSPPSESSALSSGSAIASNPSGTATFAGSPGASAAPGAGPTGFAFPADDLVAFYQSRGYDCTPSRPSTKAAGYSYRACEQVDAAGRTLVVGVVTDPGGVLADAYASVQGKAGETFLEPIDALDPLAGFLGVTLGEDEGTNALTWLAGHLGDDYDETRIGSLTLATYTPTPDDHSRLYVELATQAYLQASPAPNG
jgi:hypothetical protein